MSGPWLYWGNRGILPWLYWGLWGTSSGILGPVGYPAISVLGSLGYQPCLYWHHWGPSPICTGITGVPWLLWCGVISSPGPTWTPLPSNCHSQSPAPGAHHHPQCPPLPRNPSASPVPTSTLLLLLLPTDSAQRRVPVGTQRDAILPPCPRRAPRSCGSGSGRCGRPAAPTRPCCPLATRAPSAPAAGPAACSLPAPVRPAGSPGEGSPRGKGCWGPPVPPPRLSLAAPGCSRTHSTVVLGEWSDPLDPAAAAQTLYGHLRQAGARWR